MYISFGAFAAFCAVIWFGMIANREGFRVAMFAALVQFSPLLLLWFWQTL